MVNVNIREIYNIYWLRVFLYLNSICLFCIYVFMCLSDGICYKDKVFDKWRVVSLVLFGDRDM